MARDGTTVAFIEVKTKTDGRFGDPVEMVDERKQRRLVSMAEEYVSGHALHSTPCRFDVVAIDASIEPPKVTVYKDAFRPGW